MAVSLGERITFLRREKYWSQEELAMQMEVSRQSVSKWESDASVPELDKLIRLGEIFDVSLDYLLKGEGRDRETKQEAKIPRVEEPQREEEPPRKERPSKEEKPQKEEEFQKKDRGGRQPRFLADGEAENYMLLMENASKWMAAGVAACILSPVLFLLLKGLSEGDMLFLSEKTAGGIGLVALLVLVGGAAAVFVLNGMTLEKYAYLDREPIVLSDSCREIVFRKKQEFEGTYRGCISAGVMICVLSLVPIGIGAILEVSRAAYFYCAAALLLLVAFGVYQIIWSGYVWGCYERLLQEGEYTIEKKRRNRKRESVSSIYWCVVTAAYLLMSFRSGTWGKNWIIWPCAGVLFPVVCGLFGGRKDREG